MVNMRMRDDGVMNGRSFRRIARGRSWCESIIEQEFCSVWVFQNNSHVPHFISTSKIMKAKTRGWRILWIRRCSSGSIQDHGEAIHRFIKKMWVHPFISIGRKYDASLLKISFSLFLNLINYSRPYPTGFSSGRFHSSLSSVRWHPIPPFQWKSGGLKPDVVFGSLNINHTSTAKRSVHE